MRDTTNVGPDKSQDVTRLLAEMQAGNRAARDRVFEMVQGDLHRIAAALMGHERPDHTLQATALVNEAYHRLIQQMSPWECRAQFYGIAASLMRRVLMDHARRRGTKKRGGDFQRSSLDVLVDRVEQVARAPFSLVDEAFERLERVAPDLAAVLEQFFFMGRSPQEIAVDLDLREEEVQTRLDTARALVAKFLRETRLPRDDRDDGSHRRASRD